ncbi:MAG: hypothetical protein ACK47F_13960, partial [Flavobacteriales bacterium]
NGNSTGAIDLTVSGGTAPYTYSWSNSATSQDLSSIGAGTYTVTVTDANGCTTTASVTITQPAAVLAASTTQVNVTCFGASNGTATVTASGGTGPYTYSWNTTPAQTTATATGLSAGVYTVTITDANGCTTSTSVTITQPAAALTGQIQGQQILCGAFQATYSIAIPPCLTSYSWQVPQGMTIIDQDATVPGIVTIDVAIDQLDFTSGNIVFNALFNGGSASATLPVSLIPFTPQFLTTSACGLPNTTVTFEVVDLPGVDTYTWTPPSQSTILFGQYTDSVRVKFGSLFNSGILSVVATNACGSSPAAEFFILAPPKRPNQIVGSSSACLAVPSQLYYVDSVANATYYIWGMPTGATIISTPATNDSIYVMFQNFVSGTMSVKSANMCGSSTMRYLTISAPTLAAATSISGPQSVCSYIGTGQTITYSTPSVAGITNYIWSVPTGVTIVSGSGSNSIGVQFTAGFTGGSIGVVLSNGCSLSQQTSLQLSLPPSGGSPLPIAISGPLTVCSFVGSGSATYSVTPPIGANTFVWTVPSGVTITSGQGTASITTTFAPGFITGQLSVSVTTFCGTIYQQSITLKTTTSAAGAISGPGCIALGTTYTYSISSVSGATSYQWTVPANATIISGQGTTSVSVQYSTAFTGGTLSVTPSNSCGNGPSSSLTIGLSPIIPGQISGPLTACPGNTLAYNVTAVPGETSYIWGLPVGMSFVGPSNGSTIQVFVGSAFISGVISCKSVTGCGSSTMRYTSTISSAGCIVQLQENPQPEQISGDQFIKTITKAFVSEASNGSLVFAFENDLELENIAILVIDEAGELRYRADQAVVAGYNTFRIDLSTLEKGTYYFTVLNEANDEILKQQITIDND